MTELHSTVSHTLDQIHRECDAQDLCTLLSVASRAAHRLDWPHMEGQLIELHRDALRRKALIEASAIR